MLWQQGIFLLDLLFIAISGGRTIVDSLDDTKNHISSFKNRGQEKGDDNYIRRKACKNTVNHCGQKSLSFDWFLALTAMNKKNKNNGLAHVKWTLGIGLLFSRPGPTNVHGHDSECDMVDCGPSLSSPDMHSRGDISDPLLWGGNKPVQSIMIIYMYYMMQSIQNDLFNKEFYLFLLF